MHSCCIEIRTQSASFRNPEFQNFHKTLDLPPPTTIIGLVGAAMGVSPKMAQDFFDENLIKIGISGRSKGWAKDTWKYNKRISNMHLYDPLLDGSVIQREILFDGHFWLVFLSKNESTIDKIATAFEQPFFALTFGNSDALAKIVKVTKELEIVNKTIVENCLVSGDVVGEVISMAAINPTFSIYQTSEPIAYDLPTRFDYKEDYGRREVAEIATFSFIGQKMELNYDIEGLLWEAEYPDAEGLKRQVFIPFFTL